MSRSLLLFIICLLPAAPARSQHTVSLAFYNVENLYDTIPSPCYNDSNYTPGGKHGWNTERYGNKLRNLARVIGEMEPDVIGLCEVENQAVTRDLVAALPSPYNYIHREVGKWDGRQLSLLYKGDRFVPEVVRRLESPFSRDFLYVRGELCGQRVDIIICHMASLLNRYPTRERTMRSLYYFVDSLHMADPGARPVVMGDFNADPRDNIMSAAFSAPEGCEQLLFCPLAAKANEGMGSYAYNYSWRMFDNIYISSRITGGEVCCVDCGVFIRDWMLTDDRTKRRGFPLRTFTGNRYTNGFSDHLPVYVVLEIR